MNLFLDLIGAYLYVIIRVITLPVFLAFECFIGFLITVKHIRQFTRTIVRTWKKHRPAYSLPIVTRLFHHR